MPDQGSRQPVGNVTYSDHLVSLIAQAEAAATRLAAADPDRRAAAAASARREAARWSARLDASPLADETADAVDAGHVPQATRQKAGHPTPGWAHILKLEGTPTQDVAAVEYANLLACLEAVPALAARLFAEPLAVLREVHGLLCRDLVAPEVVGRLRHTDQALHDGAQGRMLYAAPEPGRLPGLLDALADWIGTGSATKPTVVVAGVVEERLLEWQPFEAANGRVARIAARLVRTARGLDPHGVALPERVLARDALAYHAEVAATIRRRGDLGPWLERSAEALVEALEDAVDTVDPRPAPVPPARGLALCEELPEGGVLTLPEYAERAGIAREVARRELRALSRAGVLRPQPGGRGLRYERR